MGTSANVVVVGSCNVDLIVQVPELPAPGRTVLGGDLAARPGGKGANQAVAAARLGAPTTLVAALGTDRFATTLRAALQGAGLDLHLLATVDAPTGTALIVVDAAGRNQITVAPGANTRLGVTHLDGLVFGPGDVLLTQLEIPLDTCVAAATLARTAGARVVVNAAPLRDLAEPQLPRLLHRTDVLVVNESEAIALSGTAAPGDDVTAWQAVAAGLLRHGPRACIVTLGAAGAVFAEPGGCGHVPAYRVEAVDTTGAGDAFCGALGVALAERAPLHDAVRRGCHAGALATTAVGAQEALPTADDLDGPERP